MNWVTIIWSMAAAVALTLGFQPLTFLSAEEFLKDPLRDHFACLVVDIQLAGMSGIEMSRQLAAEGARPPVIFITAHDDPAARDQALQTDCAAFFRKTDAGAQIIEAVRCAIRASAAY